MKYLFALNILFYSAMGVVCLIPSITPAQEVPQPQDFSVSVREIYTDDVLPGFPPLLNIDDPHPPEVHDLEVNTFVRGEEGSRFQELGQHNDFNYGTNFFGFHHLQLKGEFEQMQKSSSDSPVQTGIGDVLFGIKWMFYNNEGQENSAAGPFKNTALAFYPQVTVKPDIGENGQVYSFPFLVTKRFTIKKRPAGFTGNVAYEHGVHGQPDDMYWSAGGGIAITPLNAGVVSFSDQHFFDGGHHRLIQVQIGFRRKIRENLSAFAMIGAIPNIQQSAGSHVTWDAGIQFVLHKKRKAM